LDGAFVGKLNSQGGNLWKEFASWAGTTTAPLSSSLDIRTLSLNCTVNIHFPNKLISYLSLESLKRIQQIQLSYTLEDNHYILTLNLAGYKHFKACFKNNVLLTPYLLPT
jgi:hypothetical protein